MREHSPLGEDRAGVELVLLDQGREGLVKDRERGFDDVRGSFMWLVNGFSFDRIVNEPSIKPQLPAGVLRNLREDVKTVFMLGENPMEHRPIKHRAFNPPPRLVGHVQQSKAG